jgi:hypothetical protein
MKVAHRLLQNSWAMSTSNIVAQKRIITYYVKNNKQKANESYVYLVGPQQIKTNPSSPLK